MEFAKQLTQLRNQSSEEWIALTNRTLPPIVAIVLVIVIAVQAADLTWKLLESPAQQDFIPAPSVSANSGATSNPSTVAVEPLLGLFGVAPEPEEGVILSDDLYNAVDTDLNLVLHGVLIAQELPERGSTVYPELGMAIIAAGRAAQNTYRTGDEIDGVGNTRLHSVFDSCAYLDRGRERLEKLCRDETQSTVSSLQRNSTLTSSVTRSAAPAPPPSNVPSAASLASALGEVSAVLSQHMTLQPHAEGTQLVGFRVQPRGDSNALAELGLEPGDVLIEINGVRLNDARDPSAALAALTESNQANVTIRRNGEDQVKVLDMGQLQRLMESRQ